MALLEEQSVHMILSDMVMPHMSGLEFLERVKKLLPQLKIIYLTVDTDPNLAIEALDCWCASGHLLTQPPKTGPSRM